MTMKRDALARSHDSAAFCKDRVADIKKLIDSGTSLTILGIPGAGITLFLKHLASQQPLGHMVYIDIFALPVPTGNQFYKALLGKLNGDSRSENIEDLMVACQRQLKALASNNQKIVICVAGFDQLQPEFSADFFRSLRGLRGVDPSNIVFVFGMCRRIDTLLAGDLMNIDLGLFSSTYYLKPYTSQDMKYLLSVYGPHVDLDEATIERLIDLSGGHFQFLHLLVTSENRHDPVRDPFIELAFKNIFLHLNASQKSIIRKLVLKGVYPKQDDYLTNIGLVRKTGKGYELFSPLFASCILNLSNNKLPVKERRLLAILKRHQGKVVPKQDIYDAVWRGDEIGSEWALNALIYRLRNHPAFISQKYAIENYKKVGYILL